MVRQAASFLPLLWLAGCESTDSPKHQLTAEQATPDPAPQVVSISLDTVADSYSFPPPEGVNRVLSATVEGGDVRSVWLAPDAAATDRVPCTLVEPGKYQVNVYGRDVCDLLESEQAGGEFRIYAETVDGLIVESVAVRYTMRAFPKRLDFSWDRATVTIFQRSSKHLPGSGGHLRLHIGDITGGEVLVSVYGTGQGPLIDMAPLRQGETVRLPLAEEEYVLVLDRLVNLLAGRDYAVFSLVSADAWGRDQIEQLLTTIEKSENTFIRAGQEMNGATFGGHLRQKLFRLKREVRSLDAFIDQVAGRSWATSEAYQVRLPNGEIMDTATWLRLQPQGKERPAEAPQAAPPGDTRPAKESQSS
jgi:hypothetical protein